MNVNYLLLLPVMGKDPKTWYAHKDAGKLLPELKLSLISLCLAERLKAPVFDTKKHVDLDPHIQQGIRDKYMKATIHTNLPEKEIFDLLTFCRDYYEIKLIDEKPSLAEVFKLKLNCMFDLAAESDRVAFLDLDVIVRSAFGALLESDAIYFYGDEGFNIVKHCTPTEGLLSICAEAGLSLDVNMWNTGFVSVPSEAFADRDLANRLHAAFNESGMISPIAEQATLGLLATNYAKANGLEVREALEYFDHYWYYGKYKYKDFVI